jgi:hypothetical protein
MTAKSARRAVASSGRAVASAGRASGAQLPLSALTAWMNATPPAQRHDQSAGQLQNVRFAIDCGRRLVCFDQRLEGHKLSYTACHDRQRFDGSQSGPLMPSDLRVGDSHFEFGQRVNSACRAHFPSTRATNWLACFTQPAS